MNNYSETKYYFYRTKISLTEKDSLILERKTLLSYSQEAIPLVAFSPESSIVQCKFSKLERFIFGTELIAIVGFFVALIRYPILYSIINVPLLLIFILAFIFLSIFYYFNKTKKRLVFNYHNGHPAFAFSYRDNDVKQKKWIDEFNLAVRNARVNFDEDNIFKIKQGINNLEKQNIINKVFANELHQRVNTVVHNIKD